MLVHTKHDITRDGGHCLKLGGVVPQTSGGLEEKTGKEYMCRRNCICGAEQAEHTEKLLECWSCMETMQCVSGPLKRRGDAENAYTHL